MRSKFEWLMISLAALLCAAVVATSAKAAPAAGAAEMCNADAQFAGTVATIIELAGGVPDDAGEQAQLRVQGASFVKENVPEEFQPRALAVLHNVITLLQKGLGPRQIAVTQFNACMRGDV